MLLLGLRGLRLPAVASVPQPSIPGIIRYYAMLHFAFALKKQVFPHSDERAVPDTMSCLRREHPDARAGDGISGSLRMLLLQDARRRGRVRAGLS